MTPEDQRTLNVMENRFRAILPEAYQDSYEDVEPVSMGSAGLRFGADGKVAWNEIWASFCDLALAGGPPHKGLLLEPGTRQAVEAQPAQYAAVVEEISRGIRMVTGLDVRPGTHTGWIGVACESEAMTGWLLRAITVENVAVRSDGRTLLLPAAPHFRVEKEIKNVVTVMAKACHYWMDHMWLAEKRAIAQLFETLAGECPLIVPAESIEDDAADYLRAVATRMSDVIQRDAGLACSTDRYRHWLGVECSTVRAAVWVMQMIVVCNVLTRREGTLVFVPVNPAHDPDGAAVVNSVVHVQRLARVKGVLTDSRS